MIDVEAVEGVRAGSQPAGRLQEAFNQLYEQAVRHYGGPTLLMRLPWHLQRAGYQAITQGPDSVELDALQPNAHAFVTTVLHLWRQWSTEDKLVILVWALTTGRTVPIEDVLHACRAAGQPPAQPPSMSSRLTTGRIQELPHGRWNAQIGQGAATQDLGKYATAAAAFSAAHREIRVARQPIRQLLSSGCLPLQALADLEWEDPTVSGWSDTAFEPCDDPAKVTVANIVDYDSIARRAGVSAKTVAVWVARHHAFPPGLNGTLVRDWTAVQRWLHDTGRLDADENQTRA